MGNPSQATRSFSKQHIDSGLNSNIVLARTTNILNHAIVVANEDNSIKRRIKVRIFNLDQQSIPDLDLPWVFPLIPSYISAIPKVGEHVIVIFTNPWDWSSTRYYIGPIQSEFGGENYQETTNNLEIEEMK
jgi:hypothetical protein